MAGECNRAFVVGPAFSLERVARALGPFGVEPCRAGAEEGGAGVVAVLTTAGETMSERTLAALPDLRVIATASVGHEHLPLRAAAARGIWVCNVPGYCTEEVADSTTALLLALLRGTVALARGVAGGGWDPAAAGPLRRVSRVRLGLLGFGRIGRAVAARAGALGCEVWVYDDGSDRTRITAAGARPAGFEELLRGCDALSLHLPAEPGAAPLIGARELAMMRPGAVLVNTARGELLDTEALLAALRRGHLAGAALDVLPREPPPGGAPAHPRLIVTPHAAWYSVEAEREVLETALEQVVAALSGRAPEHAVEPVRRRSTSAVDA